jgi:peptidyl-prolyl cis-trans isomerase B (cyclophilin B)
MKRVLFALAAALLCGLAVSAEDKAPTKTDKKETPVSNTTNEVAVIKTVAGDMVIEFWPDVAPKTVENFKTLAKKGFYDGTAFHRIIKGFMVQGGDPLTKDDTKQNRWGTGDPGYKIKAEFNPTPHEPGVLSMARTGDPNSAGSQFFICLERVTHLDNQYTAFGRTADAASLDVVKAIGSVRTGGNDRPAEPVIIKKATVVKTPKK